MPDQRDPRFILFNAIFGPERTNRIIATDTIAGIIESSVHNVQHLGRLLRAVENELGPEQDWSPETIRGTMRHLINACELLTLEDTGNEEWDEEILEAAKSLERKVQKTLNDLRKKYDL